jgi:phosphatidylethanolamine-binding protein (PEBP) family uncharacterized protein
VPGRSRTRALRLFEQQTSKGEGIRDERKSNYIFTLYALSIDHLQQDGLTYDGLIQAINGHVVGATTIVGTFRRVPPGTVAN